MAFVSPNLVFETTIVEGTGPATLLGPSGNFLDFDSQLANADTCPYTIEQGALKEVGIGTFSTTGPTLTRTTILYSTNGGAAENFTAGTKNVYSGLPGELVASLVDPGAADGFLAQIASNTFARRSMTVDYGLSAVDGDGVAGDPVISGTYKRIEEFGAEATPAFDNATAFAAAVTWADNETNPATIVIPAGIYEYSVSPNWAVTKLTVVAHGDVRFRHTGTGNAIILDGGAAGGGVYDVRMGRIYIEAPSTAAHGVYMRAMHHCKVDFNVRGCGTSSTALLMEWCVLNEIRFTTSVNEGAFYSSGKPLIGIDVGGRSGVDSAYNTFINPIVEGVGTGVDISSGSGNIFNGGAIEACTVQGMIIQLGSNFNKFYGTDFEQNLASPPSGLDVTIGGASNCLYGIDSDNLVKVVSGGRFNKIIGGTFEAITIDSGATANMITNASYSRNGTFGSAVTDNGTNTLIRDIVNQETTLPETARGRTIYDSVLTSSAETVPSTGPWTYTNNTGKNVGMLISGGLVTTLVYKRFAGASITLGDNPNGVFELSPKDGMQITYTASFAPHVEIYPR